MVVVFSSVFWLVEIDFSFWNLDVTTFSPEILYFYLLSFLERFRYSDLCIGFTMMRLWSFVWSYPCLLGAQNYTLYFHIGMMIMPNSKWSPLNLSFIYFFIFEIWNSRSIFRLYRNTLQSNLQYWLMINNIRIS